MDRLARSLAYAISLESSQSVATDQTSCGKSACSSYVGVLPPRLLEHRGIGVGIFP